MNPRKRTNYFSWRTERQNVCLAHQVWAGRIRMMAKKSHWPCPLQIYAKCWLYKSKLSSDTLLLAYTLHMLGSYLTLYTTSTTHCLEQPRTLVNIGTYQIHPPDIGVRHKLLWRKLCYVHATASCPWITNKIICTKLIAVAHRGTIICAMTQIILITSCNNLFTVKIVTHNWFCLYWNILQAQTVYGALHALEVNGSEIYG